MNDSGAKRIVVKVGSSTLTDSVSSIDERYIDELASQLSALISEGWQPVLVSSGAIACGLGRLGIKERPTSTPELQAAASVGQCELVSVYARAFDKYGVTVSQILLTRRDTADRDSYLHARDTFDELLSLGALPIVNENDTISIEQICFGDNDSLAALVAVLVDASLVVIVSDVEGLYDSNPLDSPNAKLIPEVNRIDSSILEVAGGAGSAAGSGGMFTKVQAARVMMAAGIPLAIVSGDVERGIELTANGNCPGTMFIPAHQKHAINSKKLWLALGDNSKGSIIIDDGAKRALIGKGGSLLSVGMKQVSGHFDEDDIIDIVDEDGVVIARGKVLFGSDVLELAVGKTRGELADNHLLYELSEKPIVHRDELMLFD